MKETKKVDIKKTINKKKVKSTGAEIINPWFLEIVERPYIKLRPSGG